MIEQLPVPPAVVHGFAVVKRARAAVSIVKLIVRAVGRVLRSRRPLPSFTLTCAVNVCGSRRRGSSPSAA